MSLRGYVRKGKPAAWTAAFPPEKGDTRIFSVKAVPRVALEPQVAPERPRVARSKPTPRKALWVGAMPRQVRKSLRRQGRAADRRAYPDEARAFVAAAAARGERCPVFAAWESLPEAWRKMLTYSRCGRRKPDNLSEVHHVRGRRGSLLRDQRFWLAVSKWGHRAVHAFPAAARRLGFLCEAGLWNEPKKSLTVATRFFNLTGNAKDTARENPSPQAGSAAPPGLQGSAAVSTKARAAHSETDRHRSNMPELPQGHRMLKRGDVVQIDGGPHIVETVNESRALALPLDPSKGGAQSVTNNMGRSRILEERGEEGLEAFLEARRKSGRSPEGKKVKNGHVVLEVGDALEVDGVWTLVVAADATTAKVAQFPKGKKPAVMLVRREVNDYFLVKPRLGKEARAALVARMTKNVSLESLANLPATREPHSSLSPKPEEPSVPKPAKPHKPAAPAAPASDKPGKLGGVYGHSATSVLRALGAAGVTPAQAAAAMKRRNVAVSEATLAAQVRDGSSGRFRFGQPAALTQEQLDELRKEAQ